VAEFTEKPCYTERGQTTDRWESWCDFALSLDEQCEAARTPASRPSPWRPPPLCSAISRPLRNVVWAVPRSTAALESSPTTMFIECFPAWCGPVEKLADVLRTPTTRHCGPACAWRSQVQESSTEAKQVCRSCGRDGMHSDLTVAHTAPLSGFAPLGRFAAGVVAQPPRRTTAGPTWQLIKTGLT